MGSFTVLSGKHVRSRVTKSYGEWPFVQESTIMRKRALWKTNQVKGKRRPTVYPSNRKSVRLTVRPVLLSRKSYIVLTTH